MKKTILGLSDEQSKLKEMKRNNPRNLNFIVFEGKQFFVCGRDAIPGF
jgi:hypothetical protein